MSVGAQDIDHGSHDPLTEAPLHGAATFGPLQAIDAVRVVNAMSAGGDAPCGDIYFPAALAFTAGYVDTLGFVSLFGLFTAHVTGNFVLIGSEIAHSTHGVLLKFLAFPAFVIAVAATTMLVSRLHAAGRKADPIVLGVQAVLLVAFMVSGLIALPIHTADAKPVLAAGMLGAAAMGVQNAAGRLLWSQLTPATVMTGNVTQLVVVVVEFAKGSPDGDAAGRAGRLFWPVAAFASGAILGAVGFGWISFYALTLPIVLVLFLMRRFSPSVRAPANV